jgi:hypothetical protein
MERVSLINWRGRKQRKAHLDHRNVPSSVLLLLRDFSGAMDGLGSEEAEVFGRQMKGGSADLKFGKRWGEEEVSLGKGR